MLSNCRLTPCERFELWFVPAGRCLSMLIRARSSWPAFDMIDVSTHHVDMRCVIQIWVLVENTGLSIGIVLCTLHSWYSDLNSSLEASTYWNQWLANQVGDTTQKQFCLQVNLFCHQLVCETYVHSIKNCLVKEFLRKSKQYYLDHIMYAVAFEALWCLCCSICGKPAQRL